MRERMLDRVGEYRSRRGATLAGIVIHRRLDIAARLPVRSRLAEVTSPCGRGSRARSRA
jgi:hypothetical protein